MNRIGDHFLGLFVLLFCMFSLTCTDTTIVKVSGLPIVYLVGKVLNKDGNPVPYAIAHLMKYDIYDTTDSKGIYELLIDSSDTEIVMAKSTVDSLDSLQFLKDGQIITSVEIIDYIDTLPDVFVVQRDIHGKIKETVTEFNSIEAVILNQANSSQTTAKLFYSKPTFSYSGFVYFVYTGSEQNYSVFVNVYNPDSKFIGRSDTINFSSIVGNVELPLIDPLNAIPTIHVSAESTIGINDTFELSGTAHDNFNGEIIEWSWDPGNTGNFIETTPDSNLRIIAPAKEDDSYECVLRVMDNDSNVAYDTVIVSVETRAPVARANASSYNPGLNEPVIFTSDATDDNTNLTYYWKFGSELWVEVSDGDTTVNAPGTDGLWVCSLKVVDDDGEEDTAKLALWTGVVSDADGNIYTTVTIGIQLWTVENLRTTKYNDGKNIPLVADIMEWFNLSTPGYCYYDNSTDSTFQKKFGALYNWHVINTGKLAPAGWRVPTKEDWTELGEHLGGREVAGGKMKEADTTNWLSPNTGATNESGFSALPGGFRRTNGSDTHGRAAGWWWSSTEAGQLDAYCISLNYNGESLDDGSSRHKHYGHSVRLVMNSN